MTSECRLSRWKLERRWELNEIHGSFYIDVPILIAKADIGFRRGRKAGLEMRSWVRLLKRILFLAFGRCSAEQKMRKWDKVEILQVSHVPDWSRESGEPRVGCAESVN